MILQVNHASVQSGLSSAYMNLKQYTDLCYSAIYDYYDLCAARTKCAPKAAFNASNNGAENLQSNSFIFNNNNLCIFAGLCPVAI